MVLFTVDADPVVLGIFRLNLIKKSVFVIKNQFVTWGADIILKNWLDLDLPYIDGQANYSYYSY